VAGRAQRKALDAGTGAQGVTTPRFSVGRRQPFRASAASITQQAPQPPLNNLVQSTFFRQNTKDPGGAVVAGDTIDRNANNNNNPDFQWYNHLDRQVVNPMELLGVSGYKPHLLTQVFISPTAPQQLPPPPAPPNPDPFRQQHVAPWYNQGSFPNYLSYRLYRCLQTLGTRNRTEGTAFGGRVAGRININTMQQEVFKALCDGNSTTWNTSTANYFDVQGAGGFIVDTTWNTIQQQRLATNGPNGPPGPADRPFASLVTTNAPNDLQYPPAGTGNGTEAGVLRNGNAGGILFNVAANGQPAPNDIPQHPYIQQELLRKIYGNLTTRSNTFAVFVTTGFFEVRGQIAGRPPLLGGEVNPELRHRFFTIVDRTNLSIGDPARQIYDPNYLSDGAVVDARKQSNRPIYVPFEPVTVNGNNLTPVNLVQAGAPLLLTTVYGTLTTINNVPTLTLVDQFAQGNGPEVFPIVQGQTILYLDVGNGQERVLVRGITGPGPGQLGLQSSQYLLQLTPLGPAPNYAPGTSQVNHARGAALATQLGGNPGPQNYPIPYWQAPYANTVIAFQQILK
jgi:hypothetical protein